jgi:hypothetical protein
MTTLLRYLAAIVVVVLASMSSGCVSDVVLINPRTGETDTCTASLRGFNPWSQQEACVGDHLATGWVRKN